VPEPGPGRHTAALEGPHAGRGTRMDPNKGHGENIRTYNWTENGRRSFGRPRITASRRPDPQNPGPNGFIFRLQRTNPRRSPTWRAYEPEGSRSRRTGIAIALATC